MNPRTVHIVRGFAIQWLLLAILAFAFIGARRAFGIDEAMNWSIFISVMLFVTLACALGVIYRRPLPPDRS